jgi:2-polyprenyl-6-hydroxyphenyl methylase/3-demethylubiquinone-9 3-methyltransferase
VNISLLDKDLDEVEKKEIIKLLEIKKHSSNDLKQMWYLMDIVWDDCGCDNRDLNWGKINKFYAHPVWILNGLFIEQHEESMKHRHAISNWIIQNNFKDVVDYGGGFGTLARLIAQKDKNIRMYIYEPHPSKYGIKRAANFENIRIINNLEGNFDCLVSTDVLEHVADPAYDFANMIKNVKIGGYLVIANCFQPVIKCHLPQTFHFRYTFNILAKIMGLEVVGLLEGSHATIYKKISNKKINWKKVRVFEIFSKKIFPVLEILRYMLKPVKRVILR